MRCGDLEGATSLLQPFLRSRDKSTQRHALWIIALFALSEGELNLAIAYVNDLKRLAPSDEAVHALLGEAYYYSNEWASAEKEYQTALTLCKKNQNELNSFSYRTGLARVYLAQGRLEECEITCLVDWDPLVEAGDNMALVQRAALLGKLYARLYDYSKAVEFIHIAIRVSRTSRPLIFPLEPLLEQLTEMIKLRDNRDH